MNKLTLCCLLIITNCGFAQMPMAQNKTYCNPINIDYGYTPHLQYTNWGRHRATADPEIVNYKGDFYLFSTNQWGYWWSPNMSNWNFVPKHFLRPWNDTKDELCAPAVGIVGDTLVVFGSTYTNSFTLWGSTNPKANIWFPLVEKMDIGGWDPAFFTDDDGRFYMYNGSSNTYPLYGVELDRRTFQPKGTRTPMYLLQGWRYGWQRFGENMDNTFLDAFIEGATMTKHNGKYYLQYGAPGTEMSGYADGVVVGTKPLFDGSETAQSDPLSFKAGGFSRGAGHGATFQDNNKNYWHVSTSIICYKNTWERRIGIWPSGFDADDVMWCNTAFGDYPHLLPYQAGSTHGAFAGWFLLNYKKPITVSSTLGSYVANHAVDENIKTYWSAQTPNKGEWIQTDLGKTSTINAIQINYADQDAEFVGKQTGTYHQYKLYYSTDGKKWQVLVDKSNNTTDIPHEYVEINPAVQARFIKLENIHMPTGKFAISGLRVFGNGNGPKPDKINQLIVLRTEKDKRSAYIKWPPVGNAFAYNLYYGTAPDKLYNNIMVHDANEYWLSSLDSKKAYYFAIEAINESGLSEKTPVIKVE
jgi:xylan 1,4-beta-xylosidase